MEALGRGSPRAYSGKGIEENSEFNTGQDDGVARRREVLATNVSAGSQDRRMAHAATWSGDGTDQDQLACGRARCLGVGLSVGGLCTPANFPASHPPFPPTSGPRSDVLDTLDMVRGTCILRRPSPRLLDKFKTHKEIYPVQGDLILMVTARECLRQPAASPLIRASPERRCDPACPPAKI